MKKITLCISLLFLCLNVFAQKTWTGLGNDGLWNNPLNWKDQQLPTDLDSVVLDNTNFTGNYSVALPSNLVTVKYLTINPTTGNKIELDLPVDNLLPTAFQITGIGYGVTINAGGVLKNASGATSGYGLVINDSLRINNGGTYIHNTKRSNANIVKMLSRAPGTEKGVFVFDVPGTAGYTPSVTGRTFGSLVLSANAAGKARTYTSTAASIVTIRGDLMFVGDVSYSINFSKDLIVNGDLVQQGGIFNIATKATNNSVKVQGSLRQNAGAIITESGMGTPSIEVCGTDEQHVSMLGEIQNDVTLTVNNDNGILLDAPLKLPYVFNIAKGIIKAPGENLLTIEKGGIISVTDSLKNYVIGSIRKEGLLAENFLFPVGENGGQPIKLTGATGDITVAYKNASIADVGSEKSPLVKTLAAKGYWSIVGNTAETVGMQLHYGNQIPDEENKNIVIASFENNKWMSKSSLPGVSENNLLVSDAVAIDATPKAITFGALDAATPLPVKFIRSNARCENGHVIVSWSINDSEVPERFEIEGSADGSTFAKVQDIACLPGKYAYNSDILSNEQLKYIRIKAFETGNREAVSKVISVSEENAASILSVYSSASRIVAKLKISQSDNIMVSICSVSGTVIEKQTCILRKGDHSILIGDCGLSAGSYILMVEGAHFKRQAKTFIKP